MFDVENHKNSNNVMIKKFLRFLRISCLKQIHETPETSHWQFKKKSKKTKHF